MCLESSRTEEYATSVVVQSYAIYRFDGEMCEKLVGGIGNLTGIVFADGGVFYVPFAFTCFGVKDMPTGNGDETAPCDFYQTTDGSIAKYDLTNRNTTVWTLPDAEDGASADFLGLSDGIAIVRVDYPEKQFTGVTYDASVYQYVLNDDGSMTKKSKREVSQ